MKHPIPGTYTTATALMEALQEAGVSYIFSNLGSDHPAIIETWAQAQINHKPLPKVIVCPHEMVALSAAHGYAQATGKPQAVLVHVDAGTQNLGGALHNAAKGRVPVLILAGASPYTQEGELPASRNEYIHWIQDVFDQRGIVREYVKYDNEIRTGKNVKQLVHRALQISQSDPKGPVYLMAPREVLEQQIEPVSFDVRGWGPISPSALPANKIREITKRLAKARNPLIVTSYLGRNPEAVPELVKLSERLAIPVIEAVPYYMNFPGDHPMHIGYHWNDQHNNEHLAAADVILVLDSDVPWIPLKNKPAADCTIYYIDVDPLKENTPLWYIPSEGFFKADCLTALQQLNLCLDELPDIDKDVVSRRFQAVSDIHDKQRQQWTQEEKLEDSKVITPQWLTACVREAVGNDAIIITEAITNFDKVSKHLPRNKPGTLFGTGAGSLGWNGGASIGVKLAHPEKMVVNLTGDGSYLFSNPTPVHWIARKYNTPFLTIIYNNKGWGAPRFSTLAVHPHGAANETDQFWVNFEPSAKHAKVAEAAGGAYARTVKTPNDFVDALRCAINEVNEGRSAVIDAHIPQVSKQMLD